MPDTVAAEALYVGLISGTSADGIDAALCRFGPEPSLLASLVAPWPDALRAPLLQLGQGLDTASLDQIGQLDTALGQCFADTVDQLLTQAGVDRAEVRAIGSHGQTVRHRPHGEHAFTLQLGNPWIIAEHCGIDVVADFRRADMAAGGQGAPLMPAFHQAVLSDHEKPRAVLNLGGIANLSVLAPDGTVHGFDTGPANALMDAWCLRHLDQPFDRDGAFAATGTLDAALLDDLLADPYFAQAPPKSTGREHFHLAWLDHHPRTASLQPADVQATLLALTVRSITAAVEQHAEAVDQVLVCGGGVHNAGLMQGLAQALSPRLVASTAAHGVDPDFMEAMGFAWLARQRMLGLPGNLPSVTGANGPRLLGSVHPAPL